MRELIDAIKQETNQMSKEDKNMEILEKRIKDIEKTLDNINAKLDQAARRRGEIGFYVGKVETLFEVPDMDGCFVYDGNTADIPEDLQQSFWYDEKEDNFKYFSESSARIMKHRRSVEIEWETLGKSEVCYIIGYKKVRKTKYFPTGYVVYLFIDGKILKDKKGSYELKFINKRPYKLRELMYAEMVTEKKPKHSKALIDNEETSIERVQDTGEWQIKDPFAYYYISGQLNMRIYPGEGCWLYNRNKEIIGILKFEGNEYDYDVFDLDKKYVCRLGDL